MAKARVSRLPWQAPVVVLVLLAITITSTIGVYRANRGEERRLLRERAAEVALTLTDSFAGLQTELSNMAAETALLGADRHAFLAAAANSLSPAALAQVAPATGAVHVIATTRSFAAPASVVSDLVRRAVAVTTPGATSAVFDTRNGRALGLAYSVGRRHLAIYEELPLHSGAASSASTSTEAFHELHVSLYASARISSQHLLLTTNSTARRSGPVVTARAPFGADTWLVAVQATTPLTGSFAANAYWIVLGAGLLLTALLGFMVESLLRRRDYAMALVADRTEALQESVRELEHAQEQLVRSERLAAIGELASAVGHELRNPLGVITNAHYLLRTVLERSDGGVDADVVRHLATAEREVGAATLIVSDLLDYARAREPVTSSVDVVDLVGEVLTVMPAPPEVVVTREDETGLPAVHADRDQLRQVLLNVVSNAYEAMPNGGAVTIRTSSADGRVAIAVSDNGTGMDDETRAKVFDPFFTQKTRGIGLGLSVTRRIVEKHGGAIHIETALGAGTTFTVDFPVNVDVEGLQ